MSETITIKVKLSDEDYHDITIDFSNESDERKVQLFIRKIASFMGLPHEYVRSVQIFTPTSSDWLVNRESYHGRADALAIYSDPNDTFMQHLNDGDCFSFHARLCYIGLDLLARGPVFDLTVDLRFIEAGDIPLTECIPLFCRSSSTRVWLDKYKEIIFNSAIFPSVRASFIEERSRGGIDPLNGLERLNLRQYFHPHCCIQLNPTNQKRVYLPHRG